MAGSGYQWRAVSIIVARKAKRGASRTVLPLMRPCSSMDWTRVSRAYLPRVTKGYNQGMFMMRTQS